MKNEPEKTSAHFFLYLPHFFTKKKKMCSYIQEM